MLCARPKRRRDRPAGTRIEPWHPELLLRIAAFISHPIQYFTPLWQELSQRPDVELTVFYFSKHGVVPALDPGFGVAFAWDIDLLAGHRHVFLPRRWPTRDPLDYGAWALNRGIVDFCSRDERLLPVAFVPLGNPVRAGAEIETCLAEGAAAVHVTHDAPRRVSHTHPDYDRVWGPLAEAGVPFVLHVGGSRRSVPSNAAVTSSSHVSAIVAVMPRSRSSGRPAGRCRWSGRRGTPRSGRTRAASTRRR